MPFRDLPVSSPAPREAWLALLRSSAEALAFQTPTWLDCICEVGGYADASRLYELAGGRFLVLPMVRRVGWPGPLTIEASLPFVWGPGGPVAAGVVQREEAAAVLGDLARRIVLRTSLRPNPLTGATWAAIAPPGVSATPCLAHVLDLDGGFGQVWARRFTSTARAAVRKAERSSLVVECDTSGRLVPVFYDLYRRSIERWARQQREPLLLARSRAHWHDPPRKFQTVARRLGDACRIWVAWLDGQAAAAIIVLQRGANASYWRGAMDKELAGPPRANALLHRLAIEDACRAGCRYYHLGETGPSASLAQFKEELGGRAYPYAEYLLERLPLARTERRLRRLVKGAIQLTYAHTRRRSRQR